MSVFLSKIKVLALHCYLSLNVKTTSHKQDMEGSRHGSLIIITVINQYLAGIAFKEMQTSCVPKKRCSTNAPGWLNGDHPTVEEGQVTTQVCFHWSSNCCKCRKWSTYIKVRNCGDYFVYFLSGTPHSYCHLRYCSTD